MEADVTIDASGKYVIPGGIDPHTHMELPFGGTTAADDFRTGTIAAAHGGTTSIIDFAVQYKGEALIQGVDNWHQKAEGKCAIDYGFHLITTELEDKQIEEITIYGRGRDQLRDVHGYPGVFLADDYRSLRDVGGAKRGGSLQLNAPRMASHNEITHALAKRYCAQVPHASAPSRQAGCSSPLQLRVAESPVYIVHLGADVLALCAGGARPWHPGVAETCPVSLPFNRRLRRRLQWSEVRDDATLREKGNQAEL
jgi:dihydropyrimidinase